MATRSGETNTFYVNTATDADIDAILAAGALLLSGDSVFGQVKDADGKSLIGLLSDGALTATVKLTDQAGNTASVSDSFTLDTTADVAPVMAVELVDGSGYGIVNAA